MELDCLLKELSEADGLGGLDGAIKVAERYLGEFAEVTRRGNSVIGFIGSGDKTVLLDAHIDEIGMMVTNVQDGFVKVAPAGGIDPRILPATRVKIHGKETVNGVFCSVPPHLKKGDSEASAVDEQYIDTMLPEKAEELIPVGSRVTFCQSFAELKGGLVTGKSLDNRAGVASLIRCAELLSGKALNCRVAVLLSDMEELGFRGARVDSFELDPEFAVVVDVSFGNAPDIEAHKTGNLGEGPMIGISPILSEAVTADLKRLAEENNIPYQTEVMGGTTSTNADAVTVNRSGVKTGLVSIPLRNMHTPVEIIDTADVENTARLLAEYILSF